MHGHSVSFEVNASLELHCFSPGMFEAVRGIPLCTNGGWCILFRISRQSHQSQWARRGAPVILAKLSSAHLRLIEIQCRECEDWRNDAWWKSPGTRWCGGSRSFASALSNCKPCCPMSEITSPRSTSGVSKAAPSGEELSERAFMPLWRPAWASTHSSASPLDCLQTTHAVLRPHPRRYTRRINNVLRSHEVLLIGRPNLL
jgi:hypothetical protein